MMVQDLAILNTNGSGTIATNTDISSSLEAQSPIKKDINIKFCLVSSNDVNGNNPNVLTEMSNSLLHISNQQQTLLFNKMKRSLPDPWEDIEKDDVEEQGEDNLEKENSVSENNYILGMSESRPSLDALGVLDLSISENSRRCVATSSR